MIAKSVAARFGFVMVAVLVSLSAASAAVLHVAPGGVDDAGRDGLSWAEAFASIGYAVGRASGGDTVLVSNGVYVLTAGRILINKAVTVRSLNGRDVTVVDGNYPVTTNRCFNITHPDAVLDGFTITGGYNSGQDGGGIITAGTVRDCIITGNYVYRYGAGVFINGGTVVGCLISNNTSVNRGAAVNFGSGTIRDSAIINNVSLIGSGGGVGFWDGSGTVSNCLIAGNTVADFRGGGIYMYSGNHTVRDSIIINNESPSFPGGVYTQTGTLRLINSLIAHNDPGGIYAFSGTLLIDNCTVVINLGGGISYRFAAEGTVVNTIAYHNAGDNTFTQTIGDDPYGVDWFNCCATPEPDGDIVMNIITSDPMLDADFKPVKGSPVINAGVIMDWMMGARDLDGLSRMDRFSGLPDIGAYEFQPPGILFNVR